MKQKSSSYAGLFISIQNSTMAVVNATEEQGSYFHNNPIAVSSIVRDNVTERESLAVNSLGIDNAWTVSASPRDGILFCHCKTQSSTVTHKINISKTAKHPIVLVIGDDYVPPALGGNMRCAVVLRIHKPTVESVMRAVKAFFDGARLPKKSVVLLSFNSLLKVLKSHVFVDLMTRLIDRLGRFFFSLTGIGSKENLAKWRSHDSSPTILTVVSPHELLKGRDPIEFTGVAYAMEALVVCQDIKAALPIVQHYSIFNKEEKAEMFDNQESIDPYVLHTYKDGPVTFTIEPVRREVCHGFQDYTPDISMLFWWQIMCKVVDFMPSNNASNKIIPDLLDLIDGVAGIQAKNLGLPIAMPNLFTYLKNQVGPVEQLTTRPVFGATQQQATSTISGPKFANADIVCIGNSAMRRLVDSLNKLKVNAHFVSIGHQKRLTVSSLDQLADKNSPLFGPKPLVVVDGFDNALLKPSSYDG